MMVPSKLRISLILGQDSGKLKLTVRSRRPDFESAWGAIYSDSEGTGSKTLQASYLHISTAKRVIISTSNNMANHRVHTTTTGNFEPGPALAGVTTLTVKPTVIISTLSVWVRSLPKGLLTVFAYRKMGRGSEILEVLDSRRRQPARKYLVGSLLGT